MVASSYFAGMICPSFPRKKVGTKPGEIQVLLAGRKALAHLDDHDPAPHILEEAQAVTVGD